MDGHTDGQMRGSTKCFIEAASIEGHKDGHMEGRTNCFIKTAVSLKYYLLQLATLLQCSIEQGNGHTDGHMEGGRKCFKVTIVS